MSTALVTHSACLYHETPLGHPECSDRLRAVLHALEDEPFAWLRRIDAPRAETWHLVRVHDAAYVRQVLASCPEEGFAHWDADTALSPGTGEAALRAAGAVVAAVDAVMEGEARNAFCAVRPPGHHAEPGAAMGFCLFNNVAVGAMHARETHGLQRIAVVDFDVHHGNGTQTLAASDPALFFGSTHQGGIYPGTGLAAETGPAGNIVNVPLPAGANGEAFRAAMGGRLLPALDAFAPDFILISAGFDAHRNDPLANLRLEAADFAWATAELAALARRHCSGRIVSTLEGGYDLAALAASARAHVLALMEG